MFRRVSFARTGVRPASAAGRVSLENALVKAARLIRRSHAKPPIGN